MLGRAAVVGGGAAVVTLGFLAAEAALHHAVWGEQVRATGWFEGPWEVVPIVLGASLLVGFLRHRTGLPTPDPNFMDELQAGRTDPLHALQLVALGLVSLVGGASLGPEAPAATAGAGLGTAFGQRRPDARDEDVEDQAFAGMAGVFGALVTFPFAVPVIALEMMDTARFSGYRRLLPGLVSGTVALAVLFPVLGTPFLGLFALEPVELASWHLAAAVVLGLTGAVLGTITAVAIGVVGAVAARVRAPTLRAVLGGAVLAVCGLALPLTLFSGREELPVILDRPAAFGAGLLTATLLGKILAFAVSMRAGFFGGAILPLFFIGAVGGVLLAMAWPALPPVVAVSGVAAATAAALVPLPLSLVILAILMFSTGVEVGAVVAVAVLTSYVLVHGAAVLEFLSQRRRGT